MMGTVEAVVDIWSPTWSVAVFYLALVLVLTFRPQGLFGQREARAQ
jgi:branched-subunit amino acid ABC-type transport system permease component